MGSNVLSITLLNQENWIRIEWLMVCLLNTVLAKAVNDSRNILGFVDLMNDGVLKNIKHKKCII